MSKDRQISEMLCAEMSISGIVSKLKVSWTAIYQNKSCLKSSEYIEPSVEDGKKSKNIWNSSQT